MTRLVSGVAMAIAAFAVVWWLTAAQLTVVAVVLAALAFMEYARIVRAIGADLPFWPSLAATLLACAAISLPWVQVPALLSGLLLVIAIWLMASGSHGAALLHGAAAGLLAPIYIGLALGALVGVHALAGRYGVLTLVATVAASDTAQYYTGRTFGRRPLALAISPKKTVEGAVGGLIVAPLVLLGLSRLWFPAWSPALVAVVGVGLAIAGICGDLFESALKRAAGMKDSGALIPGHGGVLDRIDALLFAAPLFYFFLRSA